MRRLLPVIAAGSALLPMHSARAETVSSMLPVEPLELHNADCTFTGRYFVGMEFEDADGNAEMKRAAQQAAQAYADPKVLIPIEFGGLFLRAIDTKDVAGLLRFAASLEGIGQFDFDLMVHTVDKKLRFATVDEQLDDMSEYYLRDLAETTGKTCPGI